MQQPSVGRIVHYVSYGTPGGEYTSQCRAAIVSGVPHRLTGGPLDGCPNGTDGNWIADLTVINPTGLFFNESARYDEGAETPGDPACPGADHHGSPFRYCACGWAEAAPKGGTWHWPERVD